MLEAASVALVGASPRPGSFGRQLMEGLLEGGYGGRVVPVNPRYDTIFDRPCLDSLRELDEPVDLVALGVPNAALEQELSAAADVGARAAVIFATGYDDPAPDAPPLLDRLRRIAHSARVRVCGGNCMGFLHPAAGLNVCGFPMPHDMRAGGITFITHSGSAFSAFAYNDRGLGFNLLVSAGQELNTTSADYLSYALERPETRVVALFLETVRDPEGFRSALGEAARRDVPVVALKVGRTQGARAMVAAHSGALAGEDAAYEALFSAYGVVRVESLDEMADTLELLAAERRAGPGGLASVHDSGGERALFMDSAAATGVRFARISPSTTSRLSEVLEEGLDPVNPLDAWGTGNDFERIFEQCMRALLEDPDTAALAFCVDLTTQEEEETGYIRVAKTMFPATAKPFAVLSNLSSAIDRRDAASLRAAGIPVLEGTLTGLAAFRHLFELREAQARAPVTPPPSPDGVTVAYWRDRLASGEALDEAEALGLLGAYGIPTARHRIVSDLSEALATAAHLGWPVALKTAAPGVLHKTDVAGVVLAIEGEQALARAYADLAQRLGSRALVAEMAPPGIDLALGVVRDAQFGPLVMAAAGGTLVEVLEDRAWGLPPLDRPRARDLVERLAVARLLGGIRGQPAADVNAVCDALVRLSRLALDLGDLLQALDVNPLRVTAEGCVALDGLVVASGR